MPKNSYLAMHGNVSNILVNLGSADQEVGDDLDVLESEEVIEHDDLPDISDNLPRSVAPSNVFSPLAFKPCPKGPGRPKKRREGAPVLNKKGLKRARNEIVDNEEEKDDDHPENEQLPPPPPPKKRGRPKGSKNKIQIQTNTTKTSNDLRTRATKAADPNPDEEFFDSGDICEICEFPFNHPTKIGKPKMKCKKCTKTVHIPCYLKSGCTCTWL